MFFWHQAAHPYGKAVMQPSVFTVFVMDLLLQSARKVEFVLEDRFLPYTQLGMVRTSGFYFLAWFATVFSLVHHRVPPVKLPRDL